jgi:hypothetical protein
LGEGKERRRKMSMYVCVYKPNQTRDPDPKYIKVRKNNIVKADMKILRMKLFMLEK